MSDSFADAADKKKPHRERHSGRKAEKKNKKNNVTDGKQANPKAFALRSAVNAERRFRRKQDVDSKKHHIPVVDRTPLKPPPIIIAVVGPPKVGKTTLINNLIKLFTRSPLTSISGPVTIVTGKKRRVTLIECNNDINCMIDIAKVADLVLLLCDASFGFEMEVFEFLNICQVHGMPRIMGILTHLDLIKNSKTLKNTKKTLKHRFWTEVYPGAKLFYLSGILNGEYLRNEIKNLGRFIAVTKFRPLVWRTTHSYILGDRYEDLTSQELVRKNPKCDRNVSLYGYVRGIPLKRNSSVHIAGLGDMVIKDITYLPDPCPLPDQIKKRALIEKEKLIYAPFSGLGGIVYDEDGVYVETAGSHSHNLRESDDEDADILTNIMETKETQDEKFKQFESRLFTGGIKLTAEDLEEDEEGDEEMETLHEGGGDRGIRDTALNDELKSLQEKFGGLNKMKELTVEQDGRKRRKVLFETSPIDDDNDDSASASSDDEQNNRDEDINTEIETTRNDKNKNVTQIHSKISDVLKELELRKPEVQTDSSDNEEERNVSNAESEESENEDMEVRWKDNLAQKARDAFFDRLNDKKNWTRHIYGVFDSNHQKQLEKQEESESEGDEELGGIFRKVSDAEKKKKRELDSMDLVESSLMMPWRDSVQDFTESENKMLLINEFVTGKWKDSEDAEKLLELDDAEVPSDDDLYGDFEDLETGEKHEAASASGARKRARSEDDDEPDRETLMAKKLKQKELFNAEYDDGDKTNFYDDLKMSAEKQAQLNRSVFENDPDDIRVNLEGFRAGMYVKLKFERVPAEFIANFDPTYPLLIGSLDMEEQNIGFVNVKLKKHRWYKKILKASDPLIISMGWRRFQTIPLYSKLEDDMKYRFLKYTPEHLSCNAHFWGPITPQGTGILALQTLESNPEMLQKQGFRIAATGAVQESDKSTQIMKKLKLVGSPLKIYKKTAFIEGMFSSSLEVAKFEGARIKTVSGIRGQIKKAVSKPEGCFRGTFEDKILLSDIVFCRTWYKVDVPQFYNPVTTLLLPLNEKNSWRGIRTTGEIKREKGVKNPANKDSLYTPINRKPKPTKPLIIPAKLQAALPYRDKPKHPVKHSDKKKSIERVAVIREPKEQEMSTMMRRIKAAYDHKQERLAAETKERLQKHKDEIAAIEAKKDKKLKEKKKQVFRYKSKMSDKKKK